MSIAEFRALGFLSEANRLFFHPHGLALEVMLNEDGTEILSGIWDYRDDPEGVIFGGFPDIKKIQSVAEEFHRHREARIRLMGHVIQPSTWKPHD